jgi:hypothetical protein
MFSVEEKILKLKKAIDESEYPVLGGGIFNGVGKRISEVGRIYNKYGLQPEAIWSAKCSGTADIFYDFYLKHCAVDVERFRN